MTQARVTLSAKDESAAAWASFRGQMSTTQNQLGGLQGAIGGVLAAAPVAAFMGGVASAIGELDRLGDTAPKIGLTTQSLAELGYVAKLSATDTATLEQALGKLSVKSTEAAGGNKEAARSFEALGIKVKDANGKLKDNDKLLVELAGSFEQMEDGPAKTALAMDIFGKSGKELIPMLNQGAKGIEAMRAEYRAMAGDVTLAAVAAGEFDDHVTRLKAQSQAYFQHLAGELLPTINTLLSELVAVKNEVGDVEGKTKDAGVAANSLRTFLEALIIAGSDVGFVFKMAGQEIGGMAAQLTTLLKLDFSGFAAGLTSITKLVHPAATAAALIKGDWAGFNAISTAMKTDAERARKELDDFQARVKNSGALAKINAEAKRLEEAYYGGNGKRTAPVVADAAAIAAAQAAAARAAKAANDEREKEAKLLAELTGFTASYAEDRQRLNTLYAKGAISLEDLNKHQAALLAKQPGMKKALDEEIANAKYRNDQFDEELRRRDELEAKTNQQIKTAREMLESIQFETSLIGKNSEEREKAIAMRELERAGVIKGTLAYDNFAKAIDKAVGDRATLQRQADDFQNFWQSVDRTAHDFFTGMVNGNKDTWQRMKDTGKAVFFDWLYQMTAKKWLFNLSAQVSGASPKAIASVANSAGLGSGGLPGMGSMPGMEWLTDFGGSTAFAANDLGEWLTKNTSGWMNDLGGTLMENASQIGDFASIAGDAMGYLGAVSKAADGQWGSAAGTAIGTYFGGPIGAAIGSAIGGALDEAFGGKGGPKEESGYSTSANLFLGAGTSNPDAAKAIVDGIKATYAAVAGNLGASTALDVGVLIGRDPKGDAATQLQIATGSYNRAERLGGIENVGRSDEELKAEIAAETSRLLLAGLLASNLDQKFKDYLAGVDINADAATINKALDAVTAFKQVGDVLRLLGEDVSAMGIDGSKALQDLAGGIENLRASAATYYENFYSESERTAQATAQLSEQLQALGFSMPATREQFRNMVEAQDLTTASGRQTYASLLGLSGAVASVIPAADAASDALQRNAGLMQQREGLERQLMQLMGDVAGLRGRELADLNDAYSQQLQQQIWLQQDLNQAYQQAQQAAQLAMQAQQQYNSSMASAGNSIRDFIANTTRTGGGLASPKDLLANTWAQYNEILAKAKGGDADASAQYAAIAQALIDAQKGYTASGGDTSAVIAQILADANSLPATKTFEQQVVAQLTSIATYTGGTVTGLQQVDGTVAAALAKLGAELGTYFTTIDLNRDLQLSFEELKASIGHVATDEMIQRLIDRVDKNGDGMISELEAGNQTSAATASATGETAQSTGKSASNDSSYLPFLQFLNDQNQLSLARQALMIEQNNLSLVGQRQLISILGGVPGFANGGLPDGLSWVGERGPELVNFSSPARVYSNQQSRAMVGGDGGAVVNAIARLERQNEQLQNKFDRLLEITATGAVYQRGTSAALAKLSATATKKALVTS